jgi:hypothetical protein
MGISPVTLMIPGANMNECGSDFQAGDKPEPPAKAFQNVKFPNAKAPGN